MTDDNAPQTIAEYQSLVKQLLDINAEQEQKIAQQQLIIDQQRQIIAEQQETIEQLTADVKLLKRQLFGNRRERFVDETPGQQYLFDISIVPEEDEQADADEPSEPADTESSPQEKPSSSSGKKGRQRRVFPEFLDRRRIEHELVEGEIDEAILNDPSAKRFFKKTSEQLEYVPSAVYVIEHYQEVIVVANNEYHDNGSTETPAVPTLDTPTMTTPEAVMITAPKPPMLIDCYVGPSLLAHLTASRFTDHLPYYRLEEIFGRLGYSIHRSTQWRWMQALGIAVNPLVTLMRQEALGSHVLGADETPVPILDPLLHQTRKSYLWVVTGDAAHPYDCFYFTASRARAGPDEFLRGFAGIIQTDGYVCYELIAGDSTGRILPATCWAHARRKFNDVLQLGDNRHARRALTAMRQLYDIEDRARLFNDADRLALRQAESKPIVAELFDWMTPLLEQTLPKSKLRLALQYMLHRRASFERFLGDGALPIDNNRTEGILRGPVVGRKNWLYFGNEHGGQTAASLYTLTMTCNRHFIDPIAYLTDVYKRLPTLDAEELGCLLPDRWLAEHPEALLEQRFRESRQAALRKQRRRAARRQFAAAP